jgi:predicted MPP superfamily phosphohydrolase
LGIRVLQNRAVALAPPVRSRPLRGRVGTRLYVVGLGPHDAALDHPQDALRGVPSTAPRIVLMHDPASFSALPAGSAPLALAAHTHCGQIRLPVVTRWVLALAEGHSVAADGWTVRSGPYGNRLYVTCGIGMSVVPLRIDDPPQVTVVTLQRD